MSSLAQFGYGAPAPPYDDRLPPPIRNLFAIELSNYESTASLDSTAWGLALRNVSCTPHNVRRASVSTAVYEYGHGWIGIWFKASRRAKGIKK